MDKKILIPVILAVLAIVAGSFYYFYTSRSEVEVKPLETYFPEEKTEPVPLPELEEVIEFEEPNEIPPEEEITLYPVDDYTPEQLEIVAKKEITCDSGFFPEELTCYINNYREENGLNRLILTGKFSQVAKIHADWMAETGTFSHIGENGLNPIERCKEANYPCDGETLAMGTSNPLTIFELWRDTPAHNKIMLGEHQIIGVYITDGYTAAVYK